VRRRGDRGRFRLGDDLQDFVAPSRIRDERFATFAAIEFDRPKFIPATLILADHSAFPAQRAAHRVLDSAIDQGEIGRIG